LALVFRQRSEIAAAPGIVLPVPRPLPRLESLDSARLFAAAGVVWVHTLLQPGPLTDVGRFGTTYFTLAMIVFMLRHARRNPLEAYAAYAYDRICRLSIPFIIWSCVATMAYIARFYAHDTSISVPRPLDIALGTSSPLWFLHFAMLISVLGYPVVRWLARQEQQADHRIARFCIAAGAFFACLPDHNFLWLGTYYYLPERVYEVLPSVFWGVAVDYYLRHRKRGAAQYPLLLLGVLIMAASLASYFVIGFTIAAKNLAGLGLMLMACGTVDCTHWHTLSRVGRLSFGVYLIHPFAISVGHLMLGPQVDRSLLQQLGIFGIALSLSTFLAWLLRRSAYTRWLVT
jgi:peptidoglycan/LPS O-acetylase OafA/YrhL